jgi:tetratricopeptide (TPR) repeat protein
MLQVKAWIETVTIPTYETGRPEKNPIFLEKRVYQGSRGSVYPHPVVEKISEEKINKEYQAVFIENEFILIMILPSLGGRIQRAYDKLRKRDFVYYTQVIKPALVGLTGPWISGGIEFNWPQHHRPSTFDPVDFTIVENKDGSKTVWVNEVELMTRTKGMAGFTLYPGKAYLEIRGKLFNRTPFPQTFLWWANPAVKVNDHYQSIFPPDVHAVFDHGKRDVSGFPIATGTYYKVDYSPGTDISRYKNIPVPTSFMAVESKYNFIGGYEHDAQAGMLHVANHHVSPGKKQWTWGTGDFGQAWDKNLTDEDGPYIELMCGVFTDNQPDFSWLQPNEEKTFEQYFMPYAGIGEVKNASKYAAINCIVTSDAVAIKVYATSVFTDAEINVFDDGILNYGDLGTLIYGEKDVIKYGDKGALIYRDKGKLIYCDKILLDPSGIYEYRLTTSASFADREFTVEISSNGRLLIDYKHRRQEAKDLPSAATAAQDPKDVTTIEKLFLNGLHLEQYRHATYDPCSYYLEGLRRDPEDIRCNNAMGLWYLRKAQPAKAESYLRQAVKSIILRNPNPYDGEPLYNLGLCLKMLHRDDEAFDLYYKSTWNDSFQHNGFLQLARLASRRNDFEEALELVEKSLNCNYSSATARHLKAALLRKLKRNDEAVKWIDKSLELDAFNLGCLFERKILLSDIDYPLPGDTNNSAEADLNAVIEADMNAVVEADMNFNAKSRTYSPVRNNFNNYAEYALDYADAGLYIEAFELLKTYRYSKDEPLLNYYLGWFQLKAGYPDEAKLYFNKGSSAPADFCFPSKIEEVEILKSALKQNDQDAKAYYYLGNYWFANAVYPDAIACWEKSTTIDDSFPTSFRNLALAYFNKEHEKDKALGAMEKAFALDQADARLLMELDLLHKLCNYSPWKRLQFLEDHIELVEQRHDLYMERLTLYNQLGDFETAKALICERKFQPWEGGEGKIVLQFCTCNIELAKQALEENDPAKALQLLNELEKYPDNLGEGKLPGKPENDIYYWKGIAYGMMNRQADANIEFEKAKQGDIIPKQAIFYNDPQPENIFYQAKAWQKTGNIKYASTIFENLLVFGKEHMNDHIRIDYFAVSLPELMVFDQDLDNKNAIHCLYVMGLGYLGLNDKILANECFSEVLKLDVNHIGASIHLNTALL